MKGFWLILLFFNIEDPKKIQVWIYYYPKPMLAEVPEIFSTASGVKNSVLPFMVQVITIAHIIRTVTVSQISQKPQPYPSILKYSIIPQKDQHYG